MYYIRKLDENRSSISNSLHTVIVKKTINNYVYISAIGYGGGGVFEEFCGKFIYDDDKEGFIGLFFISVQYFSQLKVTWADANDKGIVGLNF